MNDPTPLRVSHALPPADLGAVFAGTGTDRAAGLRNVGLPPRPRAVSDREPEPDGRGMPLRAQKSRQASMPRRRTSVAAQVQVYVPATVREALRTAARQSGKTYLELVFDAIEATHTRLDAALARPQPATARGGLFTRAQPRPQRHDEPYVQITLRPTRDDLAVIDRLAGERAVPRSALVTAALRAHMT